MKRLVVILAVTILLATQVVPKMFVLVSKPRFVDYGVVCTMEIDAGMFDHVFQVKDPGGNWSLTDMNDVTIQNQMRVIIEGTSLFEVQGYTEEPNGLDLEGLVRIKSYEALPVGPHSFMLRIYDVEDNNSVNTYSINVHDRTPPVGGCIQ